MGIDIESDGGAIMPRGTDTTHFDDGWETLYERDVTTLPGSSSLLADNSFASLTIDGITWSLHAGQWRLVDANGSIPATVLDQVGGNHLTRVGAPTVEPYYVRTFAA